MPIYNTNKYTLALCIIKLEYGGWRLDVKSYNITKQYVCYIRKSSVSLIFFYLLNDRT